MSTQTNHIKESDKQGIVCLLFHKEKDGSRGKPFNELKAKQTYSVQEFEEYSAKGGFFEQYNIDYEVIYDARNAEVDTEQEAEQETEKAKKGRKPKAETAEAEKE